MALIYGEIKNGKRYVLTPASEIPPRKAIDPYNREQVVNLLRRSADHIAQGISSPWLHTDLHQLADHLEQED